MTLNEFVKKYSGPKLAITITGGGVSFAEIASIPGVSNILHSIYIPYSDKALKKYILQHNLIIETSAVSEKRIYQLFNCSISENPNCLHIIISAALTTTRYRKGKNHAMIFVAENKTDTDMDFCELELEKLDEPEYDFLIGIHGLETLRKKEDQQITYKVLELLESRITKNG